MSLHWHYYLILSLLFLKVNGNRASNKISRYRTGPEILQEASLDTYSLIQKYGHPCEIHRAFTEDGWRLELHRIPNGRDNVTEGPRPVVFLQHGLLSSSAECWMLIMPGQGFGFPRSLPPLPILRRTYPRMSNLTGVAVALLLAVVAVAANECPSDWTQEKLLEHPDCNKFYKCTYGQPVELDCWGDLYFNINTWECDWPANVDCGDRNIPGQEPETEAPEPETEAPEPETEAPEPETEAPEPETEAPEPETEAPEPETEAPEPETEAPEPETEAPEPETEAPEPETEAPEPETEAPEPETEAPEPETEAPEPETEAPAPETEAPATEAPEDEIEFQKNGCPVDHSIHWLLPAEDDCNGFYYCVWGEKVRRACPATLHFNRVIQVCDWPADAGCVSSFNKHAEARLTQGF